MRFYGFQKMTLLDFPGKVACTLFTGGCNMRCPFCHNALLVTELEQGNDTWDEAEVLTFLRRRKGLLDGVCVTGGEPTLQPELAPFLRRVKELGYAVKLDTNGTRPEVLRALAGEGLVDYVAMDVKNSPARYALTAGVPAAELSGVFTSMDFLLSGTVDYEFRTTVVRELHTEADIAAIADRIAGARRYFLQNFKDSGSLVGAGTYTAHTPQTLAAMCKIACDKGIPTELRGV